MAELTPSGESLKKEYQVDQEVKWCPGCGGYSILAALQQVLPQLGIPREKHVFISGIGCSSRLPYYVNTYGFHTIHGRAPAIATGVKLANPDLTVWIATGDGDALSIGGNHFIHLMRRNLDINVIMFNNRIYGLTKGQASPTSEQGVVTKSTPYGLIDRPMNPIALALSAGATFVARAIAADVKGLAEILRAAAAHHGTSFVEVYQNCVVFNDGAFSDIAAREIRDDHSIELRQDAPLLFGAGKSKGIAQRGTQLLVVEAGDQGILTYDRAQRNMALLISQLQFPEFPVPMGIFYQEERRPFEQLMRQQMEAAVAKKGKPNLSMFLSSGDVWEVH